MRWFRAATLGCLLLTPGRVLADGGTGCGSVTSKGCCQGSLLLYCVAGALRQQDCTAQPSCGWSAALNYYACGTGGGSDPSGKHPRACSGVDAGVADAAVGDAPPLILDLPPLPLDDASPAGDVTPAADAAAPGDAAGGSDLAGDGPGGGGVGGSSGCSLGPRPRGAALPLLLFGLLLGRRARKARRRAP